ncbi:MAG: hypothetical protein ACN6OP_05070 [Pseudomonadales bacterium]
MQIFKNGRAPYLDFLRNLTPQAVILSVALIAGRNLEPTCCYPENFKQTVIYICFLLMWIAALWANSSIFIEKYLVSTDKLNRVARTLSKLGVKGFGNLKLVAVYSWRKERMIFVEALVVFAIVELGLVTVVFSAVSTAAAIFRAIH